MAVDASRSDPSSLPGLLALPRWGRCEEPRTGFPNPAPLAQSRNRSAVAFSRPSGRASSAGDHLPIQAAALLPALEKATVPASSASNWCHAFSELFTSCVRPGSLHWSNSVNPQLRSEEIVAMWRFTRNDGITERPTIHSEALINTQPSFRQSVRKNATSCSFSAGSSFKPNSCPRIARVLVPGGLQPPGTCVSSSRAGSNISSRLAADPSWK